MRSNPAKIKNVLPPIASSSSGYENPIQAFADQLTKAAIDIARGRLISSNNSAEMNHGIEPGPHWKNATNTRTNTTASTETTSLPYNGWVDHCCIKLIEFKIILRTK